MSLLCIAGLADSMHTARTLRNPERVCSPFAGGSRMLIRNGTGARSACLDVGANVEMHRDLTF
eukprot:2115295-Alexandrium_andersonii.AAC.1